MSNVTVEKTVRVGFPGTNFAVGDTTDVTANSFTAEEVRNAYEFTPERELRRAWYCC
jgi:hypothetical protein